MFAVLVCVGLGHHARVHSRSRTDLHRLQSCQFACECVEHRRLSDSVTAQLNQQRASVPVALRAVYHKRADVDCWKVCTASGGRRTQACCPLLLLVAYCFSLQWRVIAYRQRGIAHTLSSLTQFPATAVSASTCTPTDVGVSALFRPQP